MKPLKLLERLLSEIETVILQRQHPVTGLLPASTSINTHGNYTDAWVRDNVYSIMSVWSLSIAFKKTGDTVRSDELAQSTIKLMRGLLQSMMRQAPKVEAFKNTLSPSDALHAKYDTATGLTVVADDAWGHLQIDATSLFLLMVAQMTASGLRIVCTYSEVDFIQNLIYYIASAYRTPDFGIWERGNKINNGKTEINASSVGMAKAALQALDGFNLFGKNASPRAVVHTVADAISLARSTLAALLPRESLSKEVDSALLSIIGFPAFAIGDQTLVTRTRDKILNKLGGNYGCKRFLWDGHQTVVEESSRIYYEHSELVNFENIESEWPLFYTYLYINALFNGNDTTAQHYREKIESLMITVDGVGLIPELYYLEKDKIAAEKTSPKTQPRVPNENVPLVWAQSLYYTGLLLDEGLVTKEDLDPLKIRQRTTRFVKPQIALVILAENHHVKNTLAKYGVISECIDDIRPLGVMSAPHLMDAYAQLGANPSLHLTGRPLRRLQSLSTSQTYDINGKQFLCLSWLQSDDGDYRAYDAKRMAFKLEQEVAHIRRHWLNQEVAVFTFMVEQRLCETADAPVLYASLKALQLRTKNENVGYASAALAFKASRLNTFILPRYCVTPMNSVDHESAFSLIERVPVRLSGVGLEFISKFTSQLATSYNTLDELRCKEIQKFLTVRKLTDNVGTDKPFSVSDLLELVYTKACEDNHWITARYCFAVLQKVHPVLADGVILLSSRHLTVMLGANNQVRVDADTYRTNQDVLAAIQSVTSNVAEQALIQEALAAIGSLVRISPELFDGLRSIQLHYLLALCARCDLDKFSTAGIAVLSALTPYALLERILAILESQRKVFTRGLEYSFSQGDTKDDMVGAAEEANAVNTDWLEWRTAKGLITHFDEEFLNNIWQSLHHSPRILFGDLGSRECSLESEDTQSSMTPGEDSFAEQIDGLIQHLHPPYYKSIVIEALYAYTQYCLNQPDEKFQRDMDLIAIVEKAASIFVAQHGKEDSNMRDVDVIIEQSPQTVQEYLGMALSWFVRLERDK